jgi:hypothetical protein
LTCFDLLLTCLLQTTEVQTINVITGATIGRTLPLPQQVMLSPQDCPALPFVIYTDP